MIYLDSAATTLQKPPAVSRAVAGAIGSMASPGRGGHPPARRAAETVFRCREEAAALFEVSSPERVVFTSSATHGLNIALRSLVRPGDTVLLSGYEHNAVTRPLHAMPGALVRTLRPPLFDPDAFLEELERGLTADVRCVVLTHVSNVFGYILPMDEAARLCREKGVPLVVDASQSAGCLPVRAETWRAAFIAMPGHKGLYGPQGTGLLLCGEEGMPLLYGGTGSVSERQEMPEFLPDRLEAGTHNVCGIAGLLEGIRYVRRRGVNVIGARERVLAEKTAQMLWGIQGLRVFADETGKSQSGVLSFVPENVDCEELAERLGRLGVAVRAGLHCAPYAHQTAGTLATGTVRVSFSDFNRAEEIESFHRLLLRALRKRN